MASVLFVEMRWDCFECHVLCCIIMFHILLLLLLLLVAWCQLKCDILTIMCRSHYHQSQLWSLYLTLLFIAHKYFTFSPHHDINCNCYRHFYLCLFLTGLKRIGDLYKRHFEEATEEVRRLEVIVAETKESSARQISMLRDSLQTLGTLTSPILSNATLSNPAIS